MDCTGEGIVIIPTATRQTDPDLFNPPAPPDGGDGADYCPTPILADAPVEEFPEQFVATEVVNLSLDVVNQDLAATAVGDDMLAAAWLSDSDIYVALSRGGNHFQERRVGSGSSVSLAFRRAIIKAYDHRCAICGVRIVTVDGHSAVAAAHIIPWRYSHNDDPRNELALCYLCHWTFGEGLVTLTDRYQVKTSPQLAVTSNLPGHLLTFNGRSLIGPEESELWPFVASMRWHHQEVFRRR